MKSHSKEFSWRARITSIRYAITGIRKFFLTEHNARIHLAATIVVIFSAIFFPLSMIESIALIIVTGLVWAAELFNTAIERMADRICADQDPAIGSIKDLAAAGVLVTALIAIITGCIIFIPKF